MDGWGGGKLVEFFIFYFLCSADAPFLLSILVEQFSGVFFFTCVTRIEYIDSKGHCYRVEGLGMWDSQFAIIRQEAHVIDKKLLNTKNSVLTISAGIRTIVVRLLLLLLRIVNGRLRVVGHAARCGNHSVRLLLGRRIFRSVAAGVGVTRIRCGLLIGSSTAECCDRN